MQIKITFSEIQSIILEHWHKQIVFAFVNDSTMNVSTKVKVIGFSKLLGLNIEVGKIIGNDLYLSYSGGGSEIIIGPLLAFLKKWLPEKSTIIESGSNHSLVIHLEEIEQLQNMLEKVTLYQITFDSTGINIEFTLKNI